MLGQSDSLSISSKLCRYKLSIKFVTTIRNFHAYKSDKLERPSSSDTRMCFFIIVNELFVYSGISLSDWKKKEFTSYQVTATHPGGCFDQAVASPVVRLMDFKLRIYW
jgi:hypothetical protein